MTTVRLRESASYGARLYAYLLGVTLLGGGCLAVGLVLAAPELSALLAGGGADTAMAVGGAVLAVLGLSILLAGYLGAGYKLIADAVAVGDQATAPSPSTADAPPTTPSADEGASPSDRTSTDSPADTPADSSPAIADDEPAPDAPVEAGPQRAPGIDPQDDAATAAVDTDADAVASATAMDEAESDDVAEPSQREDPPEPSPEEIAFGSSDGDEPTDSPTTDTEPAADEDEPADLGADDDFVEEQSSSSGSVRPAGRGAASDPLADRSDGE